jgi:integrase
VTAAPDCLATAQDRIADQLASLLRSEFNQLVIEAPVDHPVLGLPICAIDGCWRGSRSRHGLCPGHYDHWRRSGRPELTSWISATAVPADPRRVPTACAVEGCRGGRCARKLCTGHYQSWVKADRPEFSQWIKVQQPRTAPCAVCAVTGCDLDALTRKRPLCRNHDHRWRMNGKPPIPQFVTDCGVRGGDVFDLRGLPNRLTREIQYTLQRRVDEKRIKTQPLRLQPLILHLRRMGVESMSDHTLEQWRPILADATGLGWTNNALAFIRDAQNWIGSLGRPGGWDVVYERDVWDLAELGYHTPTTRVATLRFDRIQSGWLRETAKRWCRWRLSTGTSPGAVASNLYAVTRFCSFLDATGRGPLVPSQLNRDVIEAYLAWVAVKWPDPCTRRKDLGGFASFLRTIQQHRWVGEISPEAMIFNEDYPDEPEAKAKALSEFVAAQLELESNLARFAEPRYRVLTEILQRTGIRIGDARRLTVDCIDRDQHGAAYLRYHNYKMRRDARTPIDDPLADAILELQQQVRDQYSDGPVLFPMVRANHGGTLPISRTAYAKKLDEWIAVCDVRNEAGQPVRVHPHQFRHTYATRMINSGVPQHVVKKLLDHDSDTMTAHYARLSMETIRQEWETGTKVNIGGDVINEGEGRLADAIWLKNSLSRAKMALPNGYCTLPLQQTCEYANACLTCPMFLTTAEFLPQHRSQLIETRTLVDAAQQRGQERLVEMNEKVEKNLLNIISSLEASPSPGRCCGNACGGNACACSPNDK